MMGDDGAGALLAQMLAAAPLPGWEVLNGGSAPENALHLARALAPGRALVVDAADMDLPAGSVRRIPAGRLDDPFLLTTHALPLTFLIEALGEFIPRVELLGVQPETVAFGYPMSTAVRQAVEGIYHDLEIAREDWPMLEIT
jgi:hydrogenase 3 maturation protease